MVGEGGASHVLPLQKGVGGRGRAKGFCVV